MRMRPILRQMRRWTKAVVVLAAVSALSQMSSKAEDIERGKELFNYCVQCHGQEGHGNHDINTPGIAGLPSWYVEAQLKKFQAGLRGKHPKDVIGMFMRPMSLTLKTEADIKAVAAYVSTLTPKPTEKTVKGDVVKGQALYQVCVACHMPTGEGNPQLKAPPIVLMNDWYIERQLHNFKAGIRGADPKDITGSQMRPMAMTLVDDQAVKDVISYIQSLSANKE